MMGLHPEPEPGQSPSAILQILGPLPDQSYAVLHFEIADPAVVVVGASLPLDMAGAFGALLRVVPGAEEPEMIGLILDGELVFESAATVDGAPVVGTFNSLVMESIW